MVWPRSEGYPLSLHDALPIYAVRALLGVGAARLLGLVEDGGDLLLQSLRGACVLDHDALRGLAELDLLPVGQVDRKSTRLNSSHPSNSYAVFCLQKKIWSTAN